MVYYNNVMTKAARILLPYENKWVAVDKKEDRVLAFANDFVVLDRKLKGLGIKKGEAILTWVFPFKQSYAPYNVKMV